MTEVSGPPGIGLPTRARSGVSSTSRNALATPLRGESPPVVMGATSATRHRAQMPDRRPAETDAAPDARAVARDAGLRYATDARPGISRHARARFSYRDAAGETIRDREVLARIRALAIPPAWTDVWICPWPNGHLQARGRDARGRKQYRYHADWHQHRGSNKFDRMLAFSEVLPRIRRRCDADLATRGLSREKVLAAVVRLLELTLIRVGNDEYARLNQSFGLTTLRDRHAKVEGGSVRFRFRGKSGQAHEVGLRDRRLAGLVRRCQELPGQELFQYVDDDGEVRDIGSDDVNGYIREAAGPSSARRTFGPGPARCWRTARSGRSNRRTASVARSGTSSRRSGRPPTSSATPRPLPAAATSTRPSSRPTSRARSAGRWSRRRRSRTHPRRQRPPGGVGRSCAAPSAARGRRRAIARAPAARRSGRAKTRVGLGEGFRSSSADKTGQAADS